MEAALDEDERDQDILLLKQILNSGGRARISDHIDDRPYRRMQERGWLICQNITDDEAIYEISEARRKVVSNETD
jgi:hypothetical protein